MRRFQIYVCEGCYNLKPGCCNDPDCIFCRKTKEEVAEILDALLIRPVIEGKPIYVSEGEMIDHCAKFPCRECPIKNRCSMFESFFEKTSDAIETHIEWAYSNNEGKLNVDELTSTIFQLFAGNNA